MNTEKMIPKNLHIGIGCRRGISASAIREAVESVLMQNGLDAGAIRCVASIDLKADEKGLLQYCDEIGQKPIFYPAEELRKVPGTFTSSSFVRSVTGVDNVCERAALAGADELIVKKTAINGVTVAVAAENGRYAMGKVIVVGIGPGNYENMTIRADRALQSCDVIVGYHVYVDLVKERYPEKEFRTTPMTQETKRCQMALDLAKQGKTAAMVCSGDSGIYGMAALIYELRGESTEPEIEVIPGLTAACSGAALLGAPLTHDFAVISLSDRLTSWEKIEKRLEAAAEADLSIVLYNPASHSRPDYLHRACGILLRHLPGDRLCGIAQYIGREGENRRLMTLAELQDADVDMFCTVFIGNEMTKEIGCNMVTPRGYRDV
jgi:precorrin-3B C17-methyltransferase